MCIIVAKEKGKQLPSKKILETCFNNNDDGAGLMYVKNNQVIIDKGYMTFNDFYKRIKELKKEFNSDLTEKAIVFHFRIGTSGKNDKQTTHPFPITNNENELRALKTTCSVGMAHNGIISNYTYDKLLSDTQTFIRDYVSVFKELDKKFYKNERVMELLEKQAKSKLCFLDNKENIYCLGDFTIDNGIIYSNTTYKASRYNYNYDSCWTTNNAFKLDTKKETEIDTPMVYGDMTIDTFVETHPFYEVLNVGDRYIIDDIVEEVKEDDYLMLDENFNLWEYLDDRVSLIGINVDVIDGLDYLKGLGYEFI